MAEWSIVPDSKSGVLQGTVGSNPTLSASIQATTPLMGRFGFLPTKYPPIIIPVNPEIQAFKHVLPREHRRKLLNIAAQARLQAIFYESAVDVFVIRRSAR